MERPEDLTKYRAARLQVTNANAAVVVIALLHVAGAIGLTFLPVRPIFIQLMPYHILLMMLILFICHQGATKKWLFLALLIFIISFAAQWAGLHINWLFGDFTYGKILGPRLFGVPLIISVNWFILIYATGVTLQRSGIKNKLFRLVVGSGILALLDIFIEPVAKNLGYWAWADNNIPPIDFVFWFIISMVLLYVFEDFHFRKQSIVAPALLISQFLFFAVLQ